ncbi:glycosyltransferase family 4 protein [Candidatus Micrarchaeota archaeon]|nr:glycosyltransferase family 4 protein [Candidatus Micrarchaeota archaeon]
MERKRHPPAGRIAVNYVTGAMGEGKSGYSKYAFSVLAQLKKMDGLRVGKVAFNPDSRIPHSGLIADYSLLPVKVGLRHSLQKGVKVTHIATHGLAYLSLLGNRPSVITVFDAIPFEKTAGWGNPVKKAVLALMKRGIRKADAIITISQFSKKEISRLLGVPAQKIRVAYPAVDPRIYSPHGPKFGWHDAVLYVGSEQPRKNLGVLLESFAIAKKTIPSLRLVKVGAPQWRTGRHEFISHARRLGVLDAIEFIEGGSDEQAMAKIYRSASVLVFPSKMEGFGLPPLEAMACGTPVICSNAASLPEVVGKAAITLPPDDVEGFAKAIVQVVRDRKLAARLAKAGLLRAKKFSWKQTAMKTREVYERMVAG